MKDNGAYLAATIINASMWVSCAVASIYGIKKTGKLSPLAALLIPTLGGVSVKTSTNKEENK